ncbi:MAG: hypothetical protein EP349_09485 [Alphaproteobacteria bacterium]|nr:MAG: hypothetical protein EP349_09485 [Alphaproteobacteria bacterium]
MARFLLILAACVVVFSSVTSSFAEMPMQDTARDVLCKIFFEDPEAFENEDTEKCDCIPFGTVEVCQCFDGGRQALTPNGQPCLRDPDTEDPRHVKPLNAPQTENHAKENLKTVPVRHSGRVYLKTVTPDGKPHSLSYMNGDALDIVCPPGFGVEELKPVM